MNTGERAEVLEFGSVALNRDSYITSWDP